MGETGRKFTDEQVDDMIRRHQQLPRRDQAFQEARENLSQEEPLWQVKKARCGVCGTGVKVGDFRSRWETADELARSYAFKALPDSCKAHAPNPATITLKLEQKK